MPNWASTPLRCASTTRPGLLRRAGHPDPTTQQAANNERHWHERDLTWQHQCAQQRATRSWEALAMIKGMATPAPRDQSSPSNSPRCRPDDCSSTRPSQLPLFAAAAGVAQCPKSLCRVRTATQESGVCGRTYLLERAHVPTERAHVPTRETHVPTGESPRTYRRETHVPTGERPTYLPERNPRTYRREPTYLPERNYHITCCSQRIGDTQTLQKTIRRHRPPRVCSYDCRAFWRASPMTQSPTATMPPIPPHPTWEPLASCDRDGAIALSPFITSPSTAGSPFTFPDQRSAGTRLLLGRVLQRPLWAAGSPRLQTRHARHQPAPGYPAPPPFAPG